MIHRDVKTENVLLSRDGEAKLSDLGLIKGLNNGEPLTRTRTCLGTIAFVAPEQFEDAKRAEIPADIYGLGATLYHAVTGVVPFQGKRNLQILRKKIQNDFFPPCRLVPTLSAQVNDAICKALDACPEKRQASCREFMDSLRLPAAPLLPTAAPDAAPTLSGSERRRAFRFPADLAATCRPLQSGPNSWAAVIQDISGTGVRLRLARRFEPGSVLALEVPGQDSRRGDALRQGGVGARGRPQPMGRRLRVQARTGQRGVGNAPGKQADDCPHSPGLTFVRPSFR